MKKIISILTILLVFSSQAQKIKFGTKAGLNISNGIVKPYSEFTKRYYKENTSAFYGYHLGGFVEIQLSKKIYFQPELLYSLKGIHSNYKDGPESSYIIYDSSVKTSEIEIPFIFKYKLNNTLFLRTGPQLGIVVNVKTKSKLTFSNEVIDFETGNIITGSETQYENNTDKFDVLNFNYKIGAEYTLKNLLISADYAIGINNQLRKKIKNDETNTEYTNKNIYKNNTFQLSVGYWF